MKVQRAEVRQVIDPNLKTPRITRPPLRAPDAPASPQSKSPVDEVVSSKLTGVGYDGYLKFKNYEVDVTLEGILKKYSGGFVHGPGHHIGAVAAFAFDDVMTPHPILKSGDTRLSRSERSEPYVLDGFVAGRMDKEGADSSKIALAELAEEVGGKVVGNTFRKLSNQVSPTMPFESTEGDNYYLAAVEIIGKPSGDGGQMEVADLIGPKFLTPNEAIRSMDNGEVSEGGRTRTLFGRGFDSIGYVPQLGVYIHDHPALASRYDTLGLGEVVDVREQLKASRFPEPEARTTLESQINHIVPVRRDEIPLGTDSRLVDASAKHAVNKNGVITELDGEFPSQYLKLDYDRAKVADYYLDSEAGPMIRLKSDARPALAFAPDAPKVIRKDVTDVPISREESPESQLPKGVRKLGQPTGASPGQSDLYYHFYARESERPENPQQAGYVPLSDAIKMCRTGDGDAHTEALCERLADDLEWIPNLNMSVESARSLIS